MKLKLFSYLLLGLLLMSINGYAQSSFLNNERATQYNEKKRITEILNRNNYSLIEPYFFVSNRPTIQQALSDDIKNHRLVNPINHMVYCPSGKDYFTTQTREAGTIYIGAENLPKNGMETTRWFGEAYRFRTQSDPIVKLANVTIVSPTRLNFLMVKCPASHNNIIVSRMAEANRKDHHKQLSIDKVKNLRFQEDNIINWKTSDYTLPSTINLDYNNVERKRQGTLEPRELKDVSPELLKKVRIATSKHGIVIKLLLAIIEVSEDFEKNNYYAKGTRFGKMQIPSNIIKYYDKNTNFIMTDIENIEMASKYIKDLNQIFSGNIENVLKAYYLGIVPEIASQTVPDLPESNLFFEEVSRFLTVGQTVIY